MFVRILNFTHNNVDIHFFENALNTKLYAFLIENQTLTFTHYIPILSGHVLNFLQLELKKKKIFLIFQQTLYLQDSGVFHLAYFYLQIFIKLVKFVLN